MLIKETNIDERLDLLENVENGEIFMYDGKANMNRFQNKTVAKILQNTEMRHALIIFSESVPSRSVKRITARIGKTIERFEREVEIDIFFQVPRELFDLIRTECDVA